MNFIRRLALQEKKLDDSSRLDVVEIARVPDMLPRFISFLLGLRTYQHSGICHTSYVECLLADGQHNHEDGTD